VEMEMEEVNVEDVKKALRTIKNRRATGPV
jgi:hypothetical protein